MQFVRAIISCLTTALLAAGHAFAQGNNPPGSGPILGAVNWVRGTMEGGIATAVAVIAVAFVGFMMLTGRMNWKHGITVIIGCFILFGAATIVGGIQSAAQVSAG
ncbi:MAG: type VI secretion protein [Alphaproteobacteria bacterium 32-64-14]|nr:MAG: type VI secretion protein [Alphaproteobacteria bacterium 32-64-14]